MGGVTRLAARQAALRWAMTAPAQRQRFAVIQPGGGLGNFILGQPENIIGLLDQTRPR